MATKLRTIIQGAWARRTANDPENLARSQELVTLLSDYLRELYTQVAGSNPQFFAVKSAPVAGAAGAWARPADAIAVFRVERADGVEVHVVDVRDPDAEVQPRIYELGASYFSVGAAGVPADEIEPDPDPDVDSLVFFYAKDHPAIAANANLDTTVLDPTWPERHNGVLMDRLAHYLAVKDGRDQVEISTIAAALERGEGLLLQEAGLRDYGKKRRWTG